MNSSEVTADASSSKTDSFAPIDHARIVLTPILLLGGLGLLFLGGENFLSSAVPAAVLFLFAVLNGEKVYQKWSSAPEPS